MSNIKPAYWIPCLGIAFIWNDPESSMNAREERLLLLYHVSAIGLILTAGIGLLIPLSPG
jgi:hypothetical protein